MTSRGIHRNKTMRKQTRWLAACIVVGLLIVSLTTPVALASRDFVKTETQTQNESDVCDFNKPEWREEQTIAGVHIQEDRSCHPDNPHVIAAVTNGTNNVPQDVLMESALSRDAVRKHTDRDNDGDPDVIEITLEVHGINEFFQSVAVRGQDLALDQPTVTREILPGVEPAFWTFAPKTRGMIRENTKAAQLVQLPTPPIRVEQGDTVRVTLENTHYFPHTIHFHGTDHPYEVNGSGNDGVPQTSEEPVLPGESRTYEFTPRQPGTMFYHCHVVPDVHILMGLNGLFVIEENQSNNTVQTFNPGAGKVRHPSAAVSEEYTAEYDLQYQEIDMDLHTISKENNDPRVVAKQMNRNYDKAEADPDYFLLNGKSFPFTLRESLVIVEPGEQYRLRMLNGGSETISLHTHGHKVQVEAYDGVEVTDGQEITRDVVTMTAAQRVDLTLNTSNDGLHSYSEGVWFMHDHREQSVTNDGIGPGGNINMIVYKSYLAKNGIPETNTDLNRYFSEDFYEGEVPMWAHLDSEKLGEPNESNSDSNRERSQVHEHASAQDESHGKSVLTGTTLHSFVIGLLLGTLLLSIAVRTKEGQ